MNSRRVSTFLPNLPMWVSSRDLKLTCAKLTSPGKPAVPTRESPLGLLITSHPAQPPHGPPASTLALDSMTCFMVNVALPSKWWERVMGPQGGPQQPSQDLLFPTWGKPLGRWSGKEVLTHQGVSVPVSAFGSYLVPRQTWPGLPESPGGKGAQRP